MFRILFVLFAILIAFPLQARLAPTELKDMIKDSQLIVYVSPLKIEKAEKGSGGKAVVKPLEVLFGSAQSSVLTIQWSAEVHDQWISNLEKDYLLFLTQKNGKWTGTRYGRSYWPLNGRVKDVSRVNFKTMDMDIDLVHPMTMAKMSEAEKKLLLKVGDAKKISYHSLRNYIIQLKAKAKK